MRLEQKLGLKNYTEYVAHCKSHNARLLSDMHMQGRLTAIEYVRDHRDTPYGVMVAYETPSGGITFGWSSRHPTKERRPFNKSVAVHKAFLRAQIAEVEHRITSPDDMPSHIWYYSQEFMNSVAAQMDDLKRKRNAALIASD